MTSRIDSFSRDQDPNFRQRGTTKKILKSYQHTTGQSKRIVENYTDKQTLFALNHIIYNIHTDYIKIGIVNVNREINNKLDQLIEMSIDRSYHILGLTEIGRTSPTSSFNRPQIIKKLNTSTDIQ
jgi:hypothetical protein